MGEQFVHAERFDALAAHRPATARNVALLIQTELDQMMADAREAKLFDLYKKLDIAFQQTVEDIREEDEYGIQESRTAASPV